MKWLFASAALALSGCATIVEGVNQTIIVDVVPPNGVCEVSRQGERLGVSTPERRAIPISKSQFDLVFYCTAPGHISKTETLSSAMAAATVVSFFLLDFGIIDAATGAWKKYPERAVVILTKG